VVSHATDGGRHLLRRHALWVVLTGFANHFRDKFTDKPAGRTGSAAWHRRLRIITPGTDRWIQNAKLARVQLMYRWHSFRSTANPVRAVRNWGNCIIPARRVELERVVLAAIHRGRARLSYGPTDRTTENVWRIQPPGGDCGTIRAACRRAPRPWPDWCCTKTRFSHCSTPLLQKCTMRASAPGGRATRPLAFFTQVPGRWRHFFQLDGVEFRPATPHRTTFAASARSNAPSKHCSPTYGSSMCRAIAGIDMAIDLHARHAPLPPHPLRRMGGSPHYHGLRHGKELPPGDCRIALCPLR